MVTPLAHRRRTAAIPVVLGWVADPIAAPAPPEGTGELVGWLQPSEGTGAVDDDPGDDVLPQLRTADLVQHVDQDLYGAYAVARDGVAGLPAADLAQLPEAGRVHRAAQPALRASSGGSSAASRCSSGGAGSASSCRRTRRRSRRRRTRTSPDTVTRT